MRAMAAAMRNSIDAVRSLQVYVAECFAHLLPGVWEVRWEGDPATIKLPFARVRKIGPTLYAGPAFESAVTQPMHVACYVPAAETAEEAEIEALEIEEALYAAIRVGAGHLTDPDDAPAVTVGTGGTLTGAVRYRYAKVDRWGLETVASPPSASQTLPSPGAATLTLPVSTRRWRAYRQQGGSGDYELVAEVQGEDTWEDTGGPANANGIAPTANSTALGGPLRVPLWDFDGKDLYDPATEADRLVCDYMRVTDFSVNQVRDPDNDRRIMVTADIRVSWRRSGRLPSSGEELTDVTATYIDVTATTQVPAG